MYLWLRTETRSLVTQISDHPLVPALPPQLEKDAQAPAHLCRTPCILSLLLPSCFLPLRMSTWFLTLFCHFQWEIHTWPVIPSLDSELFDGRDHILSVFFFYTKWCSRRLLAQCPVGLLILIRTNFEMQSRSSLFQFGAIRSWNLNSKHSPKVPPSTSR